MGKKKPAGRPAQYKEEYAELARVACEEGGFTNLKLARLFKVTRTTIDNWIRNHEDFKKAVQEGKDKFNSAVAEQSLLKRVRGFRYTETTRETDENGEMRVTKKVSKAVAPDTKACLAFLYNRDRERWSNQQDVNVTGNLNIELVNFGEERG